MHFKIWMISCLDGRLQEKDSMREWDDIYEREKAEKKLLEKLQEAEAAVKDGNGWLSLEELKTIVGE